MANEPTSAPASKLSAAGIGTAVGVIAYEVAGHFWAFLQERDTRLLLEPQAIAFAGIAVGYFKTELDKAEKLAAGNSRWLALAAGLALVAALTALGVVALG